MDWSSVDNTPLPNCPEDCSSQQYDDILKETLAVILEEMNPVRHRAEDLALALRIRDVLPERPKLKDVMKAWLNRQYNVTSQGPPSWRLLISKIASDVGGANVALAQRLAKKHPIGSAAIPSRSQSISNAMEPRQETYDPQFSRNTSTTSFGSISSSNDPPSLDRLSLDPTSTSRSTNSTIGPLTNSTIGPFSVAETEESSSTSGTKPTYCATTPTTGSYYSSGREENRQEEGDSVQSSNLSTAPSQQVSDGASIHSSMASRGGVGGGACLPHPPVMHHQTPPIIAPPTQYKTSEHPEPDPGQDRVSQTDGKGLLDGILHVGRKKEHPPMPTPATSTQKEAPPTQPAPPTTKVIKPYPMQKYNGHHGHALIINNIDIAGHEKRVGAENDDDNLVKTFQLLGYICSHHRNQTADEILALIDGIIKTDHTHYNSFVCCLLSHGDSGKIFGSDNKPVYLDDIKAEIVGIPSLLGKPKIFIVQACRGIHLPEAHAVQFDGDTSSNRILIPDESDVFFGYATTPKTKACRFTDIGSWYIIELTKSLKEHYKELDLISMVQLAHCEVATNEEYVYERYEKGSDGTRKKRIYKQSPQMVSTLIHPVRFDQ
ncbi:PREDICTED: uncharacterized protein LOC105314888 [Amphimedon queenslandica]|uniref:Caspase family p20 domain-containing protein n=1 Tax=Amphimedon queenslandica TaxID=400682 RepID=A0A1X7VQH3_AMPQE|nr:PREDICTED: uncharacterized protein LOC105314888 [Amphimedon queenslandica]|eukprot:XP_011407609.1 PREDICTED: uncharacterized protein LOC105314888 [Amphimedon queenslandica]